MKTKIKIGIWGQFGDEKNVADGQAIRTTTIYNILKNKYGDSNIFKLSTWNWGKKPLSFFIKTIILVKKTKNLLILPADNGFKVIVPLVNFLNKFYKRNIIYIIIGGFLPNLLKLNTKYISMLNKFDFLFSQTKGQISELEELGVKNLALLPNIRVFERISEGEILKNNDQNIKLVSFSRITKDKGVEDAIEGVKLANQILGPKTVHLDFYGIISENYKNQFQSLLDKNQEFISYRGVAKFNETVLILKDYFALLFPTYYHGEGQAGVFLDSYFSALPVIASDWKYNKEFVKDNYNGFITPIKDPESISNAIIKLFSDREMHLRFKKNALLISHNYDADELIQPLINAIK